MRFNYSSENITAPNAINSQNVAASEADSKIAAQIAIREHFAMVAENLIDLEPLLSDRKLAEIWNIA